MKLNKRIASSFWHQSISREENRFRSALKDVAGVQKQLLLRTLWRNAGSDFGRAHNFERIRSVKQFQKEVPLSTYEDYQPYIERIRRGEKNILTANGVLQLHLSSGTTAPSKMLPFTEDLRREFARGISPWLSALFSAHPEIKGTSLYSVITPMQSSLENEAYPIPAGFDQDENYFGALERCLMRSVMSVPSEVGRVPDIENLYYVTLLFMLADRSLGWISVWNPSFLLLLFRKFPDWARGLFDDIRSGKVNPPSRLSSELKRSLEQRLSACPERARELEEIWKHTNDRKWFSPWVLFWPELSLISCWTDGWAARFQPQLERMFPGVHIQGKGLLATEAIVTLPFFGEDGIALASPVLAATSHFFEFRDSEDGEIYLAHELERGCTYEVIVTTAGGLYRYQLGDLVRVEDYYQEAPCLRFLGKTGVVSDVFGEKLNEGHVQRAIETCFSSYGVSPRFYFLSPEVGPHFGRYVLFLDSHSCDASLAEQLVSAIDTALSENYHYGYARLLGQLGPIVAYLLKPGAQQIYLENKSKEGRLGVLKTSCLERTPGWHKILPGSFAGASPLDAEKRVA